MPNDDEHLSDFRLPVSLVSGSLFTGVRGPVRGDHVSTANGTCQGQQVISGVTCHHLSFTSPGKREATEQGISNSFFALLTSAIPRAFRARKPPDSRFLNMEF
jgi:hypothetical protein